MRHVPQNYELEIGSSLMLAPSRQKSCFIKQSIASSLGAACKNVRSTSHHQDMHRREFPVSNINKSFCGIDLVIAVILNRTPHGRGKKLSLSPNDTQLELKCLSSACSERSQTVL